MFWDVPSNKHESTSMTCQIFQEHKSFSVLGKGPVRVPYSGKRAYYANGSDYSQMRLLEMGNDH